MTPNLKKLYEQQKNGLAGTEMTASFKLQQLFDNHGEALIEALEECAKSAHPVGCDMWEGGGCSCGKMSAQQLLATLEREAQL